MNTEFRNEDKFNLDSPPFFMGSCTEGIRMEDCAKEYLSGLRTGVRHSSMMASGMTYGEFSLYIIYKSDSMLPLLLETETA